jgi:two-component system, NarL family, response regulator NreC
MSIRILIVDDHAIVRNGLIGCIEQEEDMEVVGQAGDGRKSIELVSKLEPDLVLMDISMSDLNGIDATRIIRRESPKTKVIALSMHSASRYVREMFKAGADGYLLKDCEFDEMAEAIKAVINGERYITSAINQTVLEGSTDNQDSEQNGVFKTLTSREREVLQLIAEGHNTKETASLLDISPKTVEVHRLNIMHKLNIDNLAQLTKYAIQEGLTSSQM